MAIQYVGGQTDGRQGNTSSQSNNYALTGGLGDPVPAAGDFVIIALAVACQGTTPPNQLAITVPATWTALGRIDADGTTYDTFLNVSYKFMGGTPDTAFTTGQSGDIDNAQRWSVHVYRGVDPTTPLDVTPTSATGTGTARPNPPAAITPVTSGAAIYIAGAGASATAAAFTQSSGFVALQGGVTADVNDIALGAAHQLGWTSGSVDPAAYTTGSNTAADSWCAYTLALRPAGAAAAGGLLVLGEAVLHCRHFPEGAWHMRQGFSRSFGLLLLSATLAAQTPTPIGPTDAIGFDYLDADFTAGAVTRFEANYDSSNWNSISLPPSVPMTGGKTYKVVPPHTSGTHSVIFRACNASGCGSASAPFAFAPVAGSPTVAPANVRKVPR